MIGRGVDYFVSRLNVSEEDLLRVYYSSVLSPVFESSSEGISREDRFYSVNLMDEFLDLGVDEFFDHEEVRGFGLSRLGFLEFLEQLEIDR